MARTYPARVMVAPHGQIAKGPLQGWSYAIVRFEPMRKRVAVIVRATQPGWPFPIEVRMAPFNHRHFLPAPGVKRQNASPLIAAALEAAC